MASILTYYPVILTAFLSFSKRDHHAIYVRTQKDQGGHLFHVVGSVQNGMMLEVREFKDPALSPSCKSTQHIGWVSHDRFNEIQSICETIPPPKKQWHGPKRLVPLGQVRRCQEWAAELVHALKEKKILEALGPDDNGDVVFHWLEKA